MPRPALTEEQRRETRRRIREAASELYADRGLAEISARAIAEKAGVSVGTLYSYFGNLAELMQSLWRQPVRRLLEDLHAVAERETDPCVRLRALLESYVNFAQRERAVYRGAFMFVRPEAHKKPPAVPVEEADIPKLLIAAIRDGQAAGEFREGDPVVLAELVWSGLHGALALPEGMDRVAFSAPASLGPGMIDVFMEWLRS